MIEDKQFLRELRLFVMCIESRRDDYKAAGRTRAASTCIQCVGILADLEALIKRDMKKKEAGKSKQELNL